MKPDELRSALEAELAWRQEELAFFKNQLNNIVDNEKDRYRKCLVLILYSHMEGYIKICLQTYIQYINALNVKRRDVGIGLCVAGMHKEFLAYENLDRQCKVFHKPLPKDDQLHRLYRRVDFMESFESFKDTILHIDDQIIDTESNVWYIVLQKNLYKVGLPVDIFDEYHRDIDALINRRNSIAHGAAYAGVSEQEFDKWSKKVSEILSGITRLIYDYANNEKYLCTYEENSGAKSLYYNDEVSEIIQNMTDES